MAAQLGLFPHLLGNGGQLRGKAPLWGMGTESKDGRLQTSRVAGQRGEGVSAFPREAGSTLPLSIPLPARRSAATNNSISVLFPPLPPPFTEDGTTGRCLPSGAFHRHIWNQRWEGWGDPGASSLRDGQNGLAHYRLPSSPPRHSRTHNETSLPLILRSKQLALERQTETYKVVDFKTILRKAKA